jgi:hypothetical protein
MGITSFSVELIERNKGNAKSVIELGAQQMYNQSNLPAPYADEFYKSLGFEEYSCIDLSKENNAIEIDLSKALETPIGHYDLVTDFGTSEHVGSNGAFDIKAYYNCWKIKHDLCKNGGLIISENPEPGSWPSHGFNYISQYFYVGLADKLDYTIIELSRYPAMGNQVDGWNTYCVLRKNSDAEFISLQDFKMLGVKRS